MDNITMGAALRRMGENVFHGCSNLKKVTFNKITKWYYSRSNQYSSTKCLDESVISDPEKTAAYLSGLYARYFWMTWD